MLRPPTPRLARASASIAAGLLLTLVLTSAAQVPATGTMPLSQVSASSLQGHLSFLASDLLEGRDTPSRGLDLAAEYIAAQFRRAGLQPAGDDGYFQTARLEVERSDPSAYRMRIRRGDQVHDVPLASVSITQPRPVDLEAVPVIRAAALDDRGLEQLEALGVKDKVVVLERPADNAADPEARREAMRASFARLRRLTGLGPAAILTLDPGGTPTGVGAGRVIDPEANRRPAAPAGGTARMSVTDPEAIALLRGLPEGRTDATLDLRIGEMAREPVEVRNVAGILRGSDPDLADEYVIVSAHYDHIGIGSPVEGDAIYNGANDDASGTAAVVELAGAMAALPEPPARSILFLTFFGEEKGLLGSRYYGRHPLVPLDRTIAQVNLEQVGRTDDTEGPQLKRGSLTGFDYSDVGPILADAARRAGVEIARHPRNSDAFFGRSDNQALADVGIPAHTFCTAFVYPDYHGPLDHWDKIDAGNMEAVVRAIGLGILDLADRPDRPRWNADNPRTERYAEAHRKLHDIPDR